MLHSYVQCILFSIKTTPIQVFTQSEILDVLLIGSIVLSTLLNAALLILLFRLNKQINSILMPETIMNDLIDIVETSVTSTEKSDNSDKETNMNVTNDPAVDVRNDDSGCHNETTDAPVQDTNDQDGIIEAPTVTHDTTNKDNASTNNGDGSAAPTAPSISTDNNMALRRIRKYTETSTSSFKLFGMSVQGKGHIEDNKPCQDYHKIQVIDQKLGTGVVVISDGAGSKRNSDLGSALVCNNCIQYLKDAINKLNWDNDHLPDQTVWDGVIRKIIELIQYDLKLFADKDEKRTFDSLGATLMILFFTPVKSYFAHIGDGRAGVLTASGWKSVMTPHKGEEANQTVFVTNRVLNPGLRISGVPVPETMVIEEPILAFAMMSDGCENGLWMKSRKEEQEDGKYRYLPMNQPFEPALTHVINLLTDCEESKRKALYYRIIDHYNEPLKQEIDDKTLCLGFCSSRTTDTTI